MGLERSSAAKFATTVFHESFNDFDVYVEDTANGYQKIFALLISKALAGSFTLERVFPLGSRQTVISAALAAQERVGHRRKSIFIVDGDLYLLCGENISIPSNVISLPCYCIENILLDKDAVIEFMYEETSDKTIDNLSAALEYDIWLNNLSINLKKIFTVFAASHLLCSGIKTVSRGHKCILKNPSGEACDLKINDLRKEIYEELITRFGREATDQALISIEKNIDIGKCFLSTYVSAKDFTLPMLYLRVREITNTKVPNLNFKIRLASKVRTSSLIPIAEKIGEIIGLHPL